MLVVHGIDAWTRHRRATVRKSLRRVDHIAGVSQLTLDRLQAWADTGSAKMSVLPNCVDLERFTPGPKPKDLATGLGLYGRVVLLTLGRLASEERYKGFDEIIEILPALADEIPTLSYLVCGNGPDRERLQSKARQLGVADRVVFSGFVPEDRKVDFYRLADAYVMPSRGEGFGIVYLEAAACGIPVLGSAVDGSREALRGGLLGELVDPADTAQLRDAVLRTLRRNRGRPRGLETFSFDAFQRRVHCLIKATLNQDQAKEQA